MRRRFVVVLLLGLLMLASGLSACGGSGEKELTLAPESALPDFVRSAPYQVQEAYRFAIANPEVLSNFPCYCGCGAMGHQSNLECYVQEVHPDGSVEFDNHAFG